MLQLGKNKNNYVYRYPLLKKTKKQKNKKAWTVSGNKVRKSWNDCRGWPDSGKIQEVSGNLLTDTPPPTPTTKIHSCFFDHWITLLLDRLQLWLLITWQLFSQVWRFWIDFVGFCPTGNKSSFEPQTEELLIAVRFSRSIGRRVVWTPLMLLAAVTTMGIQPNFGNAGSVNTLIINALAKAANRPPMGSSVCSEL
jgi:hypothetical protein